MRLQHADEVKKTKQRNRRNGGRPTGELDELDDDEGALNVNSKSPNERSPAQRRKKPVANATEEAVGGPLLPAVYVRHLDKNKVSRCDISIAFIRDQSCCVIFNIH